MSFLPPTMATAATKPPRPFAPPIRSNPGTNPPPQPTSPPSIPDAAAPVSSGGPIFFATKSAAPSSSSEKKPPPVLPAHPPPPLPGSTSSSSSLGQKSKAPSYLALDEMADEDLSNSFMEDFLDTSSSNRAFLPVGQGDISASVIQESQVSGGGLDLSNEESSLDLTRLTSAKPYVEGRMEVEGDEEDDDEKGDERSASQVLTDYLDKMDEKWLEKTMDTLSCSQISEKSNKGEKEKGLVDPSSTCLLEQSAPPGQQEEGDASAVYSQSFFDETIGGLKANPPKKYVKKRGQQGTRRSKKELPPRPRPPLTMKLTQMRGLRLKKISDQLFESAVDRVLKQYVTRKEKQLPTKKKVLDRMLDADAKERLAVLQKTRTAGTWVECCKEACKKWRFLPNVKDPATLPSYWTCSENPNPQLNDCSYPQESVEEDDMLFVETKFTVGSLVWAKLEGFPYWPALIDDDPDTEVYFWTDNHSSVPSWYHVVFFDRLDKQVARAWIRSSCLLRFTDEEETAQARRCNASQTWSAQAALRLEEAVREAETASKTDLSKRRDQFCFLARFKGKWGLPWSLDFTGVEDMEESDSDTKEKQGEE